MQTKSRADELFGEPMQKLRAEALQEGDVSAVGSAVRAALITITRAYLHGQSSIHLTVGLGVGNSVPRTPARMEAIRQRLAALFGEEHVTVVPDPDYHLGVLVLVTF